MHLRSWVSIAAQPAALYPAEAQHAVIRAIKSALTHVRPWGRGAHTQDAGHDGDARVFGLALGIVDAQRLEGGETDGLGAP